MKAIVNVGLKKGVLDDQGKEKAKEEVFHTFL